MKEDKSTEIKKGDITVGHAEFHAYSSQDDDKFQNILSSVADTKDMIKSNHPNNKVIQEAIKNIEDTLDKVQEKQKQKQKAEYLDLDMRPIIPNGTSQLVDLTQVPNKQIGNNKYQLKEYIDNIKDSLGELQRQYDDLEEREKILEDSILVLQIDKVLARLKSCYKGQSIKTQVKTINKLKGIMTDFYL